jgi:predicted secreted protein
MELDFFKSNKWIAAFAVLVTVIFLIGGCVPANHLPSIINLKAERDVLSPLSSCLVECVASDPDGDGLVYEWSASKGNILDVDGATIAWSAPESEGIYNITVKVTDGNGGEVTDSITITVRANHPPTITSIIADKDWVTPLGSCHIRCNAEDPDGDELSYGWSADGGDISGTNLVMTWTVPEAAGIYTITVVVTDGYGGEDTRSLTVSVSQNPPPVIEDLIVTPKGHEYLKKDDGGYMVGKAMSCDFECIVSDTSGELVYGWSCDDGEISGEGSMVTWTAPDRAVKVTVTVTVSDAYGNMISKSIVLKVVSCSKCTFG